MTAAVELPWVVANKDEGTLPKAVATRLLELAKAAGFETQVALANAMKVAPKTVERAASGQGSQKFGKQLREFLVKKGVTAASTVLLDPMAPAPSEDSEEVPYSEEEWARMGALINEHAPNIMAKIWPEIREYGRACEIIEQQLTKMGRVK